MSSLNIVADQNVFAVESHFHSLGSIRLVDGRGLTAADLQDADVLLVRSITKVNEALVAGSPVRFVGTATSGFDHVDKAYLARNNIGFSHAPGSNANSVVEYVLAAIAATGDKLEQLLAGEPLGIVGYGNIGKAVAARCTALGINYEVYDPWLAPEFVDHAASLVEVLGCGVISIHAELTRRSPWPSYRLLGEDELAAISPETLLVNAGRGEIVNNKALLELRRKGLGPISVLDVWEGEPTILPGLLEFAALGTAHIAGYSLDGKFLATKMLRDAVFQYFGVENRHTPSGMEAMVVLQVPPGLEGADLLRWAVHARYDIREDDRLLRAATIGCSCQAATLAFDQLRKTYRARRELWGSSALITGDTGQEKLLSALGCGIVRAS